MKNTKRIFALLVCIILVISVFTGCSSKFDSVGEYLQEEDVQASLNEEIAALEGTGISMEVYAEGNALVYDCIYDIQIDLSDETIKASVAAALEEACEANSTTYTDIVAALKEVVDADDICVRLVYRNADNSIIYTHEYN